MSARAAFGSSVASSIASCGAALLASAACLAQQAGPQAAPIAHTDAKEVQVSGAVEVRDGQMLLDNGSAITAGTRTVDLALTRGGELRLCQTTQVHLSHDRTIDAPDASGLMMALDRGAIETDYQTGKYSDVLLTPDLRILVSPPGHAALSVRVNARGDTCMDNRGADAPYITVTSQFEDGLYRLRPGQHVTFERGSLRTVVDNETEPCGCPSAPLALAGSDGKAAGGAGSGPGSASGPASADNAFPLAESEGLAPPPPPPTTPVAAPGEVHVQVTVPLTYNGEAPPVAPVAPVTAAPPQPKPGLLHRVGHFFAKIFGGS